MSELFGDIIAMAVGFIVAIAVLIWTTRHNHGADDD